MNKLNISLSPGQAAFALFLEENAPYLLPLWDFEKCEYRVAAVESYLKIASHGEEIMARFFLGVFRNDNFYNFDIFEAAKVLDPKTLAVINAWLTKPFFP